MTDAQIKRWTWAGRILILFAGLAGVLAAADYIPANVRQFAALAVALLGVASRWCEQQLPARKEIATKLPPAGPAVLVVALLGILAASTLPACPNGLAPGYRAVTVTVQTGNTTGSTLAGVCRVKRLDCVKAHGADSNPTALEECVRPCHKALTAWIKYARPSINSATTAAFATLETARQAKASDSSWIAKLRPGVCGLIKVLGEWRDLLGTKAEPLLNLLATVEGIVCSR